MVINPDLFYRTNDNTKYRCLCVHKKMYELVPEQGVSLERAQRELSYLHEKGYSAVVLPDALIDDIVTKSCLINKHKL